MPFFKMVVCFWFLFMILSYNAAASPKSKSANSCTYIETFVNCTAKELEAVPKNLPKWISHLDLNRNKFTQIEPLTFQNFEHLLVLKLKNNKINSLKDGSFYGLLKIEKLMLDNNEIKVITKAWLYGLESLKKLSLSHNKINKIYTDAWQFCPKLVLLNLAYNDIVSIETDTFKSLSNLQNLSLNNNKIKIINNRPFTHLPKLKVLNMNNNRISGTIEDANGAFYGLAQLTKFYLAGNNIKSINSNSFIGLRNVTLINLADNNITTIQRDTFSTVPALKKLIVNSSNLFCDCQLEWFLDWIHTKNFKIQASCGYPQELRGKALNSIPAKDLICVHMPKPRLIEEPDAEIMALKGENVTLNCVAVSSLNSNMTVVWKKDNLELGNPNVKNVTKLLDKDVSMMELSSQLNLLTIDRSQAGKYQCVVNNIYGTIYSQKSLISVLVYPTFSKTPKDITVQAGQTAKLECAATGDPPPEVAWHKDGGNDFPAARERRMHVIPADDVFFILNANPSDAGVYRCTAHNAAGTAKADAHLQVYQKPQLVKGPEDKELAAGEHIVLQCMAQGVPKPTISWFKDGDSIVPTERHFFIAEGQILIIVDSVQNDSGVYECHINNTEGNDIGRSRIIIKSSIFDSNNMIGIIVITVVCCAVFTSTIWVAIIYQTRRTSRATEATQFSAIDFPDPPLKEECESGRSSCKDSGTGDSARRSSDDLAEFMLYPKPLHSAAINEV